jgi:hypothetical protein
MWIERPRRRRSTTSEAAFTGQVLQAARLLGWQSAHFRPARTARGWRTPVQGDGKGFPDLILLRGPRLVVAELKVDGGRLRPEQESWLAAFRQLPGAEVHVWRPRDWDQLTEVLR